MAQEAGRGGMTRRRGVRNNQRPPVIRSGSMTGPASALSSIEVRIVEKYSASQVHLPLSFQNADFSSVEEFQYDFTLEQDVVRRGEARKRSTVVQEARKAFQPGNSGTVNGVGPPAHLQAMLNMSSEILQPTPSTGPVVTSSSEPAKPKHPSMASLRDFESQNTDPFEMAELKTIDVMAELSSVLQPNMVTTAAPAPQTSGLSTATATVSTAGNLTTEQRSQPLAGAQQPPTPLHAQSAPGQTGNNLVDLAAPSAMSKSVSQPSLSAQPQNGAPVRPTPAPRARARLSEGSRNAPPVPQSPAERPKPSRPPPPAAPTPTRPNRPQQTTVAPQPAAAAAASIPPQTATSAAAAGSTWSNGAAAAAEPPPSYSSVRGVAAPTFSPTEEFPPPYPVQPPMAREPKPIREAPPPPYTALASEAVASTTVRPSDYELKDVYSKLKRQEKKVVDKLAPMGFPRPRLARTVQRLGTDEGKVLEFIILVNKLTEPPHNYPGDSSETALINNESDEEKAIESLKLVFELKEMGFGEAVIHEALKETKNKRNEAVDYLISHA